MIAAHYWWDYGGALVNLATGLLVVIVTVGYVDWVLRRHEADMWGGTDARIQERVEILGNSVFTAVRIGLGVSHEVLGFFGPSTADAAEMHRRVLRASQEVLEPQVHERVVALDQAGWSRLESSLQSAWNGSDRLLDRFYARLRPRQIECLLDIQSAIEQALVLWQTFPDVLGVPLDRLPASRTPPEVLQADSCATTSKYLCALLQAGRELDRA
jgi:hypothetical protein